MKKVSQLLIVASAASLLATPAQAGLLSRLCKSKSRCCTVAPACSTPMYTAPACSTPIYSAPACSTPMYTAPACSTPMYSTPASESYAPVPTMPSTEFATPAPAIVHSEPSQLGATAATTPDSASIVSHKEAFAALTTYVINNKMEICDFKSKDKRYESIINELSPDEKLQGNICFPAEAVWNSRPELVAEIISIFKDLGVM